MEQHNKNKKSKSPLKRSPFSTSAYSRRTPMERFMEMQHYGQLMNTHIRETYRMNAIKIVNNFTALTKTKEVKPMVAY